VLRWFWIASLVTIIAACLGVRTRERSRAVRVTTWIIGLLALLVLALILLPTGLTVQGNQEEPWTVGLGLYVCMLIGTAAKYGADLWGGRKLEARPVQLLAALCTSPLIFQATWPAVQHDLTIQTCLLAFQNGFCWKAIYDTVQPKGAKAARRLEPAAKR